MIELPTKEDFNKLVASNGCFSILQMFFETSTPATRDRLPPIFTLKPRPHKGLPSAYEIYMDSIDEYDAATKLAPSLRVWEQLVNANWFREGDPTHAHDGLVAWRGHMRARDASLAKKVLLDQTIDGNTTAARAVLANSKINVGGGRKTKKVLEDQATKSRVLQFHQKG